ncbi:MAG: PD40 domain-containing protein [Bacteroidales bacterium]|jgi:hypothetical protein|nr:PD40 domain-containing protein [Bacteroidales bacterium]NLH24161.1 hypothetical protein [Bacteroidales bacterium]
MRKKLIIPALAALLLWSSCTADISNAELRAGYPPIYPDYCGVTVPCNIAPMHFQMSDNAIQVRVMAEGADGKSIRVKAREVVTFRISEWKDLLASSTGSGLQVTVQAKYRDKGWVRYDPFTIYVSPVPMNDFLVYRLIAPGYEVYSKMGIYQRDLGSFLQTPLLENTLIPGNCMNCHSFYGNNPDKMSIHIRGELGGTILKAGDKIEMLNTKTEETGGNCVYPYWHPSGEYVVYSVNQTIQAFHAIRERRIEVIDLASDIVVYHPQSKQLLTNDLLRTDAFETFPSFSPDGRTLYFSSSQSQNIPEGYDKIRYDLCAIAFDPQTGTFGDHVDTLIHAAAMGKSISFARPSPDGKHIMFTLSDYGNFSIWHKEADLWLYDLEDGSLREMKEVNSNDVESYHSWSSEGTWFVFSSRRLDGLYTRPFFASIDKEGNITKPFLLPQKKPLEFYNMTLFSYNVPEFVTGKVDWDLKEVEKSLTTGQRDKVEIRR